jgi:hypothetical protein
VRRAGEHRPALRLRHALPWAVQPLSWGGPPPRPRGPGWWVGGCSGGTSHFGLPVWGRCTHCNAPPPPPPLVREFVLYSKITTEILSKACSRAGACESDRPRSGVAEISAAMGPRGPATCPWEDDDYCDVKVPPFATRIKSRPANRSGPGFMRCQNPFGCWFGPICSQAELNRDFLRASEKH